MGGLGIGKEAGQGEYLTVAGPCEPRPKSVRRSSDSRCELMSNHVVISQQRDARAPGCLQVIDEAQRCVRRET